ncbi:nicotinamide mononucleotide transporter [Ginsengibacter hankyongi]|uniref:Nicotinamide riboside transporter PnuC n=2 Tax=Ginsengibacter hankyongi TaxID=2607284 RepID=A0A5J5IFW1_9BACT|nr:nicotinamide mononucleotide transporter [Ginsengibacter hankyongi]
MAIHEWWYLMLKQVAETDWLQWLAVALGVAEVLLAKVNNIWLYPAGIAATVLSVYILLLAGLYAESLLNGYYIVMSIYGWWYWIKKKNLPPVKISTCSRRDWITVAGIIAGSFVILALLLKNFTPSTVPLWDAWVSATAWAGMWLLAKRKIENWILLNVSNAFGVPLLFYKQLPLFAALTVILFVIGVQGYIQWRKIINAEKAALIKI